MDLSSGEGRGGMPTSQNLAKFNYLEKEESFIGKKTKRLEKIRVNKMTSISEIFFIIYFIIFYPFIYFFLPLF